MYRKLVLDTATTTQSLAQSWSIVLRIFCRLKREIMTYNSDRLDRIEANLETVKDILLSTARRSETADERISALSVKTDARIDRLAAKQDRTQEQLEQLREDVDIAFQTIKLLSENTDRRIVESQQEMHEFRTIMTRLQMENRQIWEYLMRQYQSGNGDGGTRGPSGD